MQKPSVGRIVHYYPHSSDSLYAKGNALAAMICWVWSDSCVNLCAFDANGFAHSRSSVLLKEEEDSSVSAYAHWPVRDERAAQAVENKRKQVGSKALPKIDDDSIERMVKEAGADVAPRVTKAQIDALVEQLQVRTHHFDGTTSIVAIAALPSGFVAGIGFSSPVSTQNFRVDIGESIASSNAIEAARDKLWELEGYRLRCQLSGMDAQRQKAGES